MIFKVKVLADKAPCYDKSVFKTFIAAKEYAEATHKRFYIDVFTDEEVFVKTRYKSDAEYISLAVRW